MTISGKRKAMLALAAVPVLIGAALLVRTLLFERVESRIDTGFQGEAARLHLFAFQEMMKTLGIPTRHVPSLRRLPPTDHVLWVAAESRHSPVAPLIEWASRGGHLVVVPIDDTNDPLLEALGVARVWELEDDSEISTTFASERARPLLSGAGRDVVRFDGDPEAAWFLTVRVGDGAATILADGAFLHNDAIELLDHALIGWTIAHLDGAPAGIDIAYRDPKPSVWFLLTKRAWPVAISLAALALCALLFLGRRFGPLITPPTLDRRQFSEHVRASGDYLWAVANEDVLLAATRRALGHRLGRGHQPAEEELEEMAVRTASGTGLEEGAAREALSAREVRDRQHFTRIIRVLETLRRAS